MSRKRNRSHTNSQTKSENNLSIYNKLYTDSKERTSRLNLIKDKHKHHEFSSLSNDSDSRTRFFVPKIDKNSKKLITKQKFEDSHTKSAQELLFEYSKQQKEARKIRQEHTENQSLELIKAKQGKNVLPKSRKILRDTFLEKFYILLENMGRFLIGFIGA